MVPGGVKDRLAKKKAAAGTAPVQPTAEPTAEPTGPTGAPAGTVVSQANGEFYTKSAEGTWAQSDEKGTLTGRPAEGPDSSMALELEKQSAQAGVQQPTAAPVQPTASATPTATATPTPTATAKPIAKGKLLKASDGFVYEWQGAQWVNQRNGRMATQELGAELTKKAQPVQATPTAAPVQPTATATPTAAPVAPQKPVGGVVPQAPSTAGMSRSGAPQAEIDPKTGVVAAPEPETYMDKIKRGAQAVGDKITTAAGGSLASKTRQNPNATRGQKIGATVGAGIGRAMSGGAKAIGQMMKKKGGQAPAPAQAQAQPKALMPIPGPTTAEIKSLQKRTLGGDLEAGKQLVAKLSQLKTGGYDADNFIQAAAPVLKKGGLPQSDPQAYTHFTKLARSMRAEAYEHVCKILEHAGISWADLGYEVLLSESVTSHVMLIETKDIQLYNLKRLSGI
jgi:hypothetical protein